MKSVMISFDQASYEKVVAALDRTNCRGFTLFPLTNGRGSNTGEPHFGSHAWPATCSTIISIVEDEKVDRLLQRLHEIDKESEMLGLRAFVWDIEKSI